VKSSASTALPFIEKAKVGKPVSTRTPFSRTEDQEPTKLLSIPRFG
jgi:hypothetical protein